MRKGSPPLVAWHMSCGFPSPAGVYHESELDIHEFVIAHPEATLYVRVSGDSMEGTGIFEGVVLVVDRALVARENAIIVALVNSEFTVKRLSKICDTVFLLPENSLYDLFPLQTRWIFACGALPPL